MESTSLINKMLIFMGKCCISFGFIWDTLLQSSDNWNWTLWNLATLLESDTVRAVFRILCLTYDS